jgi:hypothetical protein
VFNFSGAMLGIILCFATVNVFEYLK